MQFLHKKKWGQNFLKNTESVLTFIETLDPQQSDRVVEIGPGMGVLSEYMILSVGFLQMLEIDPELIGHLKEKFADCDNLEISQVDVLEVNTKLLQDKHKINKVAGALPYNISKKIVQNFCADYDVLFDKCVFILQKEVAHDYAATGKKGSFLNHYFSIFNDIYLIIDIEKSQFKPEPKVDSSIILFKSIPRKKLKLPENEIQPYVKFLRNCFMNPRKKLKKNLKAIFKNKNWDEIFIEVGFDDSVRVEELNKGQILKLFHAQKK